MIQENFSLDYGVDFATTPPDDIGIQTDAVLTYNSSHTIYEKVIKCTVKAHELKYTYNPSTLVDPTDPESNINSIFINSEFTPYVTTVGLYNEANELLAIAKFDYPIRLPKHTDITFVIRIDF
jgi:hypothetical protein